MVERAVKIRKGLDEVTMAREHRELEINNEEWKQIDEVLEFLEPFAQVTNDMEGAKYPTLNAVIPLYNLLIDHVMDWVEGEDDGPESQDDDPEPQDEEPEATRRHLKETIEGAKAARSKLVQYYQKTTSTYLIPIVLDPRLKLAYFQNNKHWKDLTQTVVLPA